MSSTESHQSSTWKFDNSYLRLPERFYSRVDPEPVAEPQLILFNRILSEELGLVLEGSSDEELAQIFSGNRLPQGAESIAQAYSGHQFGYFTRLGDGRAHLLGEHLTPAGVRVDIQLKGSGKTPYGRGGDGRAALGPMLREYIISEALHALGVATTRSLAVVATGENVYRESVLPGAVLTRVASSHLRVGTFEHFAAARDNEALRQLADYAIRRHYPHLIEVENPYLGLIEAVMERQIALVVDWLRIGFIHGVMNTDNMTISGESIDFGPCAFMDEYDPQTVFSSIDHAARYAFENQPHIVQWNLARFAEALLPLIDEDLESAAEQAGAIIHAFDERYPQARLAMMRRKLGLVDALDEDQNLVADLLQIMQQHQVDYTNTFRELIATSLPQEEFYQLEVFQQWWGRWQERLTRSSAPVDSARDLMRRNNPAFIPRNHRVDAALSAAEENADFNPVNKLLEVIAHAYEDRSDYAEYRQLPSDNERVLQTFCGT